MAEADLSAMSDNKVEFVMKHAHDPRVVAAVIGAPAFLSGLSAADINVLKTQIANRFAPETAAAKEATMKALGQVESGWRAASREIANRAGMTKSRGNGQ